MYLHQLREDTEAPENWNQYSGKASIYFLYFSKRRRELGYQPKPPPAPNEFWIFKLARLSLS